MAPLPPPPKTASDIKNIPALAYSTLHGKSAKINLTDILIESGYFN